MSGPPLLACVLAGGRSSRMGSDKAMLLYHGRPLVQHAVERLRSIGCQVAVCGSRPDLATYAPVLTDLHPGCGPLGGIEAGLAAAPAGASVLFLPVDLPLLPASFLALLLERAARTGAMATLPTVGGRPQPLCAVYVAALLPGVTVALDRGDYKVMRVLDEIAPAGRRDVFAVEALLASRGAKPGVSSVREGEPAYRWFSNANTPQEFGVLAG